MKNNLFNVTQVEGGSTVFKPFLTTMIHTLSSVLIVNPYLNLAVHTKCQKFPLIAFTTFSEFWI